MKTIEQLVLEFESPEKRIAFSTRYPFFKPFIIKVRILLQASKNRIFYTIARKKGPFFEYVIARHQSVLRRKLGESDPELQEKKVINIKRACEDLNGLIIRPGEVFSLWEALGKPEKKRGYVNGMLLSQGKVIEGMGGGLCQLSNFLCWIFLHTEMELVERHHHSMDVFPDSGRVLPFGSGATCLYNFVDLKFKNVGLVPLQIKIWVTDTHLKGQIVSPQKRTVTFSIQEQNHCFIKRGDVFFRYNEIYRIKKKKGVLLDTKLLFRNFAPVLYTPLKDYFEKNKYRVLDL